MVKNREQLERVQPCYGWWMPCDQRDRSPTHLAYLIDWGRWQDSRNWAGNTFQRFSQETHWHTVFSSSEIQTKLNKSDDQYAVLCHLAFTLTWPAILDSFDTLMAKLEKSILPLYMAAQILSWWRSRISSVLKVVLHWYHEDIEETLVKINVANNHEDNLAMEEAWFYAGACWARRNLSDRSAEIYYFSWDWHEVEVWCQVSSWGWTWHLGFKEMVTSKYY